MHTCPSIRKTVYTFLLGPLRHVWDAHIHLLITNKKYTLSYVYWDHTNTSQGYIDIRLFSLFFSLFFFSFVSRRQTLCERVAILQNLTRFHIIVRHVLLLSFFSEFSCTDRRTDNFAQPADFYRELRPACNESSELEFSEKRKKKFAHHIFWFLLSRHAVCSRLIAVMKAPLKLGTTRSVENNKDRPAITENSTNRSFPLAAHFDRVTTTKK